MVVQNKSVYVCVLLVSHNEIRAYTLVADRDVIDILIVPGNNELASSLAEKFSNFPHAVANLWDHVLFGIINDGNNGHRRKLPVHPGGIKRQFKWLTVPDIDGSKGGPEGQSVTGICRDRVSYPHVVLVVIVNHTSNRSCAIPKMVSVSAVVKCGASSAKCFNSQRAAFHAWWQNSSHAGNRSTL